MKQCANCRKAIPKRQKYCSRKCMGLHRRTGEMRACKHCGGEFYARPEHIKKGYGIYCSRDCMARAFVKSVTRICRTCKQEFEAHPSQLKLGNGIYCSVECRTEAGWIRCVCIHCGKLFRVRKSKVAAQGRSFCSYECHDDHRRMPGNASQRRRARLANLPATLTNEEWQAILTAYGYACAYCGAEWHELDHKLQQEHVLPVVKGGGYTADNIVPACKPCNYKKHKRTPEEAGMPLREVLP